MMEIEPYSLAKKEKKALLEEVLNRLTQKHYFYCEPYQKIVNALGYNPAEETTLEKLPFIPVRLFKNYELVSVEKKDVFKVMTSSGTSGQRPSQIFLDRETSMNQTKVLAKITASFVGKKRLPMLVIDTQSILKCRNMFSARGAGILGFSMLGTDVTFALNDDMSLNFEVLEKFLERHALEDVLLFGFTSIIWEHFHKALLSSGKKLHMDRGVLIHGGGWKKLIDQAVDLDEFKSALIRTCGIKRVHNYYGMVEQTGSIYMECEKGHLHTSVFSEVMIRNADFTLADHHVPGLIELASVLPGSYPGHLILSEDIGEILGEDDCACGRLGKYFKVYGRVKNAEIRGCSDTVITN